MIPCYVHQESWERSMRMRWDALSEESLGAHIHGGSQQA
jgi:hypothetical protein